MANDQPQDWVRMRRRYGDVQNSVERQVNQNVTGTLYVSIETGLEILGVFGMFESPFQEWIENTLLYPEEARLISAGLNGDLGYGTYRLSVRCGCEEDLTIIRIKLGAK